MKKRIVRRRSAPTSKSQKPEKEETKAEPTIPTIEEREAAAADLKDVVPPLYQHNGWDRLNSIPDYTEKMTSNRLETIIANYYSMNENQFKAIAKDPAATILEKQIAQQFLESLDTKNKDRNHIREYLQTRFAGAPKKEIVFTGNVKQRLQHETKEIPDFENMTPEQLDQFQEMLDGMAELPYKEVLKNESGSDS